MSATKAALPSETAEAISHRAFRTDAFAIADVTVATALLSTLGEDLARSLTLELGLTSAARVVRRLQAGASLPSACVAERDHRDVYKREHARYEYGRRLAHGCTEDLAREISGLDRLAPRAAQLALVGVT